MGILDLLFPVSCLNCGLSAQAGKSGKYFCEECLSKVQVLNRFDPLSKTFSIFRYEGIIRKGIIKIKYNFAYDIAKELAEITAKNMKVDLKNAVLIPIPLHKKRQNWRGFNQSEILGKLIAEKLNWRFEKDLLIRPFGGQNQVGLAKSDRVRNMRGKYAANNEALRVILEGQSVIPTGVEEFLPVFVVFDDVATTGSTIKEAIKVLEKSGAQKVLGLTVAR